MTRSYRVPGRNSLDSFLCLHRFSFYNKKNDPDAKTKHAPIFPVPRTRERHDVSPRKNIASHPIRTVPEAAVAGRAPTMAGCRGEAPFPDRFGSKNRIARSSVDNRGSTPPAPHPAQKYLGACHRRLPLRHRPDRQHLAGRHLSGQSSRTALPHSRPIDRFFQRQSRPAGAPHRTAVAADGLGRQDHRRHDPQRLRILAAVFCPCRQPGRGLSRADHRTPPGRSPENALFLPPDRLMFKEEPARMLPDVPRSRCPQGGLHE